MGNDWFYEYFINELKAIGRNCVPKLQPDWSQNNGTKPDYVKNRPFYTGDPVETVLVEETTVAFELIDGPDGSALYVTTFPQTFEATGGETYKVSWDGTVYECTSMSGGSEIVIGNLSIMSGPDTGEPFLIVVMNGDAIDIATADTSASHTISISRTVVPVVKIDRKYLAQPDWNQNDDTQPDYVKNRTHYEESAYVDYALSMSVTTIVGFSLPEVGETITVKINGVDSAETVKEAESSLMGCSYKYIGNIDFDSLSTGGTGWFVGEVQGRASGLANPDTTISLECIVVHKINNKFINFDGFTRTFDYYFKNYTIYKTLYDNTGNECVLYTCIDFILPDSGLQLLGFMNEMGLSKVGSTSMYSCLVTGYVLGDTRYYTRNVVLGTNVDDMKKLAANSGYTFTTKPNA